MKKYRLCAIVVVCALLFAGCGNAGDEAEVSDASQVIKDRVYTVFVDSVVPSGELDEKGYITATDSAEYADASENLNFNLKISSRVTDNKVTELSKTFELNGNSYNLSYKESTVYEPSSTNVEVFDKDKIYDEYVLNNGEKDEVKVTYNRDTGKLHSVELSAKEVASDESITDEAVKLNADKIIRSFLDENEIDKFEFQRVERKSHNDDHYIEVTYYRIMYGYKTEQVLFVRFNNDGTLREITYGYLGFFTNAKCHINALDQYESLLNQKIIQDAENELKKICPEEAFENGTRIIGFDADGNCLLHMAYLFEDKTLVKYYVNLFELSEKTDVVAK